MKFCLPNRQHAIDMRTNEEYAMNIKMTMHDQRKKLCQQTKKLNVHQLQEKQR